MYTDTGPGLIGHWKLSGLGLEVCVALAARCNLKLVSLVTFYLNDLMKMTFGLNCTMMLPNQLPSKDVSPARPAKGVANESPPI